MSGYSTSKVSFRLPFRTPPAHELLTGPPLKSQRDDGICTWWLVNFAVPCTRWALARTDFAFDLAMSISMYCRTICTIYSIFDFFPLENWNKIRKNPENAKPRVFYLFSLLDFIGVKFGSVNVAGWSGWFWSVCTVVGNSMGNPWVLEWWPTPIPTNTHTHRAMGRVGMGKLVGLEWVPWVSYPLWVTPWVNTLNCP